MFCGDILFSFAVSVYFIVSLVNFKFVSLSSTRNIRCALALLVCYGCWYCFNILSLAIFCCYFLQIHFVVFLDNILSSIKWNVRHSRLFRSFSVDLIHKYIRSLQYNNTKIPYAAEIFLEEKREKPTRCWLRDERYLTLVTGYFADRVKYLWLWVGWRAHCCWHWPPNIQHI